MTAVLAFALLAVPPKAVTVAAVRSAWQAREPASGDVSWRVTRDSREAGFGFESGERPGRTWRLRFDRERARWDFDRLTIDGRDGEVRPMEASPDRARLEFRYLLLEERLAGPQPLPAFRPHMVVLRRDRPLPVGEFGPLERLLAQAPLLAWRPLSVIDATRLAVTHRRGVVLGRDHLVLEERRADGLVRELWVEPDGAFRIARMIETRADRTGGQIDFGYGDGLAPSGWSALRFDAGGDVVEFAAAERTELRENVVLPAGVFEPQPGRLDVGSGARTARHRQALRSFADWAWLPAAVVVVGVACCFRRATGAARRGAARAAVGSSCVEGDRS